MNASKWRDLRGVPADSARTQAVPRCLLSCAASLIVLAAAPPAQAQNRVVGFGKTVYDSSWNEDDVEVSLGYYNTAALRSDGSIAIWGLNWSGLCKVPELPSGVTYTSVALGFQNDYSSGHALALRTDGWRGVGRERKGSV